MMKQSMSRVRSMSVKTQAPAGKAPKPRPRGTKARVPGAGSVFQKEASPLYNKGGGAHSPFAPTSTLVKKKALPKRCRAIMQAIEGERVQQIHEKRPLPPFRPGDVLDVTMSAPSARKGTLRFHGICIARRNRGIGSSFTLRNVIQNSTIERTFQLYSPQLLSLTVLQRRKARRAKLYYLREHQQKFSKFA